MIFVPMPDMGWVAIGFMFGMMVLVLSAPVTIFLEAIIIGFVFGLPFKRSLTDSFLMNLASGILGLIAVVSLGPEIVNGLYTAESYYRAEPGAALILFAKMMGIPCVMSILVEGFILGWIETYSPRQTIWLVAVLSNLVSYLGLFAILMLLS